MADSAVVQNRLLTLLISNQGRLSLDHLHLYSGRPRKRVVIALGRLLRRGFVEQIKPKPAFTHDARGRITANETPSLEYRLTKDGRAFVAAGIPISSGPKGPISGHRRTMKETFRARLWRAFRLKSKATIPDLVEIASRGAGRDEGSNARQYMRHLVMAGIAVALPVKTQGFAPTSNGFKRFALVVDLGPLAPVATRAHLFNPNLNEKIPYREKSK